MRALDDEPSQVVEGLPAEDAHVPEQRQSIQLFQLGGQLYEGKGIKIVQLYGHHLGRLRVTGRPIPSAGIPHGPIPPVELQASSLHLTEHVIIFEHSPHTIN